MIGVKTAFGRLNVQPQSARTLRFFTDDGAPITVNGVAYRLNQHLHLHEDGSWHLFDVGERWGHLYARRTDRWTNDEPSHSASKKIRAELERVAAEFAKSNPDAMSAAGEEDRRTDAKRRLGEIKALEERVAALREEIALIEAGGVEVYRDVHHTNGWQEDRIAHIEMPDGTLHRCAKDRR